MCVGERGVSPEERRKGRVSSVSWQVRGSLERRVFPRERMESVDNLRESNRGVKIIHMSTHVSCPTGGGARRGQVPCDPAGDRELPYQSLFAKQLYRHWGLNPREERDCGLVLSDCLFLVFEFKLESVCEETLQSGLVVPPRLIRLRGHLGLKLGLLGSKHDRPSVFLLPRREVRSNSGRDDGAIHL